MSLRVLIAVTHLLGAGHLTRAAAISRGLAQAGHAVTLVSGGRPSAVISTEGFELVQLPPVQAAVGDFTRLRDDAGREVGPDYLVERTKRLVEVARATRPDVVITELFPFGRRVLSSEFLALLDAAGRMRPRPLIACSIRDILAAPSRPEKAERAHAVLARHYDAVLVHGDPMLVPLEASWPVGDGVGTPIIYTGYVDTEPKAVPAKGLGRTVTVSGGSSAAALPLYRAAIEAAGRVPDRPWHVLVGKGVSEMVFEELAGTAPPNAVIERARADFRTLLCNSAVFVGQAGYNTVTDLLAARPRAVLVPFEQAGETEQRQRAERLVALGVATLLPESELSARALAAVVRDALAGPPPPAIAVARDGVRRTAEAIGDLASRSRTEARGT